MRVVERAAWAALALAGCGGERSGATAHAPPARTTGHVAEAELATVTLTAEAEARLGVETAAVTARTIPRARAWGGELMVEPGRAATLAAPVAGVLRRGASWPTAGARVRRGEVLARLVPLAPTDRDLRAQATREVATAAARYEAAQARATRAAQLAQDRAGSVRASEEAVADREAARATLEAARARRARLTSAPLESDVALDLRAPLDGALRQVTAVEGQPVTAGAALFEVVADDALWVRVPVYAGAAASLDPRASARVLPIGANERDAREATTVEGPPTADPLLATVDRYYRVENPGGAWRPGERVAAWLPERAGASSLVVPSGAVVYDLHGGAWLYVTSEPRRYARRRVEVERVAGDVAVLTRGVTAGERVVTVGAAELYGTEFGAGH